MKPLKSNAFLKSKLHNKVISEVNSVSYYWLFSLEYYRNL